ncbi:MAG: RNA ligase family protein [Deltaproteobacteria bacterium]|nr:RNA ligase family protein [Deltaproteobacteria bacterium]MBN2672511.1 RNA ligase family protein [Deltaproteobacteria bacterium]
MSDAFFKYPATPYLTVFPGVDVRDDKIFSDDERETFLTHSLTVEEKIDGANLGISFDSEGNLRAQHRGGYVELPGVRQWGPLEQWLRPRTDLLFECLLDRFILFGEWCFATHSIRYEQLPDWFIGFDVFDKCTGRFLSCVRRNMLLEKIGICNVPFIAHGRFTLAELERLLTKSRYATLAAEGLYLRYDDGDWLKTRAKMVRVEFVQSIGQHWSKGAFRTNLLHRR